MKFYFNGRIQSSVKAIDAIEPGFLFGWGVFETVRIYKGKPAFLPEHVQRLKAGCKKILLRTPGILYKNILSILLDKNRLNDAYGRITIFKKRTGTGVVITVAPFVRYNNDNYKRGFKAIIASSVKSSRDFLAGVKSISYADNMIARTIAEKQGKQESLFLNESGFLVEGSRSNLFFVKEKTLCTPSVRCGLLNGITRQKVIALAKKKRICVRMGEFRLKDLLASDEAFLTSSLMEVMPLAQVNGKLIRDGRPGQMTQRMHILYREMIKQKYG